MIVFIISAIVYVAAAKPNPGIGSYGVDGVGGVLYEFPEYEDPDMAILQLAGMGAMPVLTVLEVEKDSLDSTKPESTSNYQQLAVSKKVLDEVIERLHMARSKLEAGNSNIFIDIDKSIHCLKNIERQLRSNTLTAGSPVRPSFPMNLFGNGKDLLKDLVKDLSIEIMVSPSNQNTTNTTTTTESPETGDSPPELTVKTPLRDVAISTDTKKLPTARTGNRNPIALYSKRTIYKTKWTL